MEARGTEASEARVTGSFEPLEWESNSAESSLQAHIFEWLEMVFPIISSCVQVGRVGSVECPAYSKHYTDRPHVVAHAYSPGPPEAGGLKV